jgi:hypothetical protein
VRRGPRDAKMRSKMHFHREADATHRVVLWAQDLIFEFLDPFQNLGFSLRGGYKELPSRVELHLHMARNSRRSLQLHEDDFLLHLSDDGKNDAVVMALFRARHMKRLWTLPLGTLNRCAMGFWSALAARRTFLWQ